MSNFFSSIKGFGRSSKKNKQQKDQASLYSSNNNSHLSLRRSQSPVKISQQGHQQHPQQHAQSQIQQQTGLAMQQNVLPLFLCEPFVRTALVKGSFKTIVQLPKYVDPNEWVAQNIFEMYNNLNQFYGVIGEYVKPELFPTMNAGPNTDYLWVDQNGKTTQLPANQYIEYVLSWIGQKINDQTLFPTKSGVPFPPHFIKTVKNIARQMFRIFAHMYYNHFDKILNLSLEAHWNSFFAHFVSFVKEFGLIEQQELEPLSPLIENFAQQGKIIS
ncbi:CBK1 kinase activator protein MOB2 AltName: Full=Maintenance of ploidy protein MOB2; AltName: Full=MPS1 binder 2 [Cyberlindnera jadinii]|uniref:MOB2 protein n=1 Tax=Cyberlindnera jadinii (strain ATCC 18201 / CBS 1600 / BCRC 20928 / JCM 3617 / NBRC 0987 / NRRL Y-1542) TaxID=983966 RepID=A0A0H5C791_CYBJN|nr:CBK1 kinase activator protein MOB2 AltName: Full=Maintenance of ploidy protein MOB2; AltName: Full=MPS1 binder 2 [Cyberlindnera jadinii]